MVGADLSVDLNQYKQLFIEEAREHIDNLTKGLLMIEKDPSNIEALNNLFRSAHTLKGSSAMMGLKDIATLTHAMEDVFDGLRKGEKVTTDLINVLLECIDALTYRLDKWQSGIADEIDVNPLLQKLKLFLNREGCETSGKEESQMKVEKPQRTKGAKKGKADVPIFEVKVKLNKDCVFKAVRARMVIDRLSSKGEIVKINPSLQDIELEKVGDEIDIFVRSNASEKELKEHVESISEVEQVQVIPAGSSLEVSGTQAFDTDEGLRLQDFRAAQTVRIHSKQLDKLMNLVGELIINKIALRQCISANMYESLKRIAGNIDRLVTELQDLVMQIRMVPVSQIFDRFPRLVRDLSLKRGKKVDLLMEGRDIEMDRTVLDEIGEPLVHLIRNCIDHGIEYPEERLKKGKPQNGTIKLSARREGDHVIIEVEDDGAGIDPKVIREVAMEKGFISKDEADKMSEDQLINLIFIPGFSTAKEVTETSGRGVGMDVVKTKVESLGGTVQLKTEVGKGTVVTLKLPLTVAIIKALLVEAGGQTFAIPSSQVSEVVRIKKSDVKKLGLVDVVEVRGKVVPLLRLNDLLNIRNALQSEYYEIVIANVDRKGRKYGLAVDSILRLQEILVKPLDLMLSSLRGFGGVTILGSGQVVLVLDVPKLIEKERS